MKLAQYMALAKVSDQQLAEKIGTSRVSVTRYRNMVSQPSGDTIKAIVAATDGAVTANDLLGIGQADPV